MFMALDIVLMAVRSNIEESPTGAMRLWSKLEPIYLDQNLQ